MKTKDVIYGIRILSEYQKGERKEPDVSQELDYNIWLYFKGLIPLEKIGEY